MTIITGKLLYIYIQNANYWIPNIANNNEITFLISSLVKVLFLLYINYFENSILRTY